MSNYKAPPLWPENLSFESWKQEVDIWLTVTDLKTPQQAGALVLSLTGEKREIAKEIGLTELNSNNGPTILLDKLKEVYSKNSNDEAYEVYAEFEAVRRDSDTVMEYIARFDRANTKLKNMKMIIPDGVLACKVLLSANLLARERQLVLAATPNLTYSDMKGSLKRIFSENITRKEETLDLKTEPAFVTSIDSTTDETQDMALYSSNFRGKGRSNWKNSRGFQKKKVTFRGKNPLDSTGRVTTCAICGSRNHWQRDCPDNDDTDKSDSRPKDPTFLTFACFSQSLIESTYKRGILDSACTKTVAGTDWMNDFVAALPRNMKEKVTKNHTTAKVVFGGGDSVESLTNVVIPVSIGSLNCNLSVEVVPGSLPLLISLKTMSDIGFLINFSSSQLFLGKTEIIMHKTPTGHLTVDLVPKTEEVSFLASKEIDQKELRKLHRQFGHCSNLLKNAGYDVGKLSVILEEIVKKCEICDHFGRSKSNPVVSLPLASDFNEVVALDLHQLESKPGLWYLHVIDVFTRYSEAMLIQDKRAETVVMAFNSIWVLRHGPPKKLLTDNGTEFVNETFLAWSGHFNVEMMSTAAEAPWSNGCCERHNQVLTEMFLRICADNPKLPTYISLRQAVFAKNVLFNFSGYSPHQLVYGKQPRIPTVLENQLPALEDPSNESVRVLLKALYDSRSAFVAAENSERIKRALRHNVRTDERVFKLHDKVYYQRNMKWHGPAVIGFESTVYFLRHSGMVYRVQKQFLKHVAMAQSSTSNEFSYEETVTPKSGNSSHSKSAPNDSKTVDEVYDNDEKVEETQLNEDRVIPNNIEEFVSESEAERVPQQGSEAAQSLKSGQRVKFVIGESEQCEAVILNRAGKARGKNRDCYNIEFSPPDHYAGQQRCLNLNDTQSFEILSENSNDECFVSDCDI